MISNILPSRLTFAYQNKKLVSLENCYMHLKPYFRIKKNVKNKKVERFVVEKKATNQLARDSYSTIEQNQILYAKILTEKLLKV